MIKEKTKTDSEIRHKCVKCKRVYEPSSEEIINGCICGNKSFFFVKSRKIKNEEFLEINDEDNQELIIFDTEVINIKEQGKYEIDLDSLMKNNNVVYSYGEGKYSIDLSNSVKKKNSKIKK